jgi:hypothetical protein
MSAAVAGLKPCATFGILSAATFEAASSVRTRGFVPGGATIPRMRSASAVKTE